MSYPVKKEAGRKYTWQDYLTWHDEERWEVFEVEPPKPEKES